MDQLVDYIQEKLVDTDVNIKNLDEYINKIYNDQTVQIDQSFLFGKDATASDIQARFN
jgi:hypothetical protein